MWVTCPKRSESIPVTVPLNQCLFCGGCQEALNSWMSTLFKVNKTEPEQELWLKRKAHKRGGCPRYRERVKDCTAKRKKCPYAWFCAEDTENGILTIYLEEKNMFMIEKEDGTLVASKEKDIRKVEVDGTVKTVYSATKKLIVKTTLVPLTEKGSVPGIKLPDTLKKIAEKAEVFCQKDTKSIPEKISLREFFERIQKEEDMTGATAALIDKQFVPQMEIKLVPLGNGPTKKPAAKPAAAKTTEAK